MDARQNQRSFKLTHRLPLPILEQDKDLWDELEMEANALTATDAPLWDKVQSGLPALTPDFDAEALSESLFGDSSGDGQRSLQIQKADFTVNSIIDKINRGKVNLRPSYQREYVWTVKTA